MRRKAIFCIVFMLVFSSAAGSLISAELENKSSPGKIGNPDYTHNVLGEFGTATTCGYCIYAHGALKNLYSGGSYPFYYISLVTNKNTHAYDRAKNDYNVYGYPTLWWDGGYLVNVGASSVPGAQSTYASSITSCGSRAVSDIDLSLDVDWLGPVSPSPEDSATDVEVDVNLSWSNSAMNITVGIDNNEGATYDGHLRVYVTEVVSSMGWYDAGGELYTFPFLDYAFDEDINLGAGSSWDETTEWNGKDYNNGYGDDFGIITQDNTMVIAAVFNDEWHQGYSRPPSSNPFDAYYVDETEGCLGGTDTDPKTYDVYFGDSSPPPLVANNISNLYYIPGTLDLDTNYYWKIIVWDSQGSSISSPIWSFTTRGNDAPYTPSDPQPEDGETDVDIDVSLSWTGGDPDEDEVTYDVYFGDSTPPPKVKSNQTSTTYDPPGELDFDTTYLWKIVAWDPFNYSSAGQIWSFTTEENLPPYKPSNPDPEDEESDVTINSDLSWTGGDPNSGDSVTYEIYFGMTNPPPLIESDYIFTKYYLDTLELDTTYYWQIIAWDSQDLSTSGDIWCFTTESVPNQPPGKPTINGPLSGKCKEKHEYKFLATDPEGEDIFYYIEWGDGDIEEWIGPHKSGEEVIIDHIWSEEETYEVRAKAKDIHDDESDWNSLKVTIPKNTPFNFHFKLLNWLFKQSPLFQSILQQILGILLYMR